MGRVGSLISLNTGMPVKMMHGTKEVETGIFKSPVGVRLQLTVTGLAGDGQADLVHHGGPDKAVCVYSAQHFDYWAKEWNKPVEPGAFGENFTVSAATEKTLCIGDVVRIGGAVVQVSQPRQPCFKLGAKHGIPELPADVQQNGYTGFYFRVLREGDVGQGDELLLEQRHPAGVTIEEANRVMHRDKKDKGGIERLLAIPELSESWRDTLTSRLEKLAAGESEA